MSTYEPDVATAGDIQSLTEILARVAPGLRVGTQGRKGRLWATITGSGADGFTDEETELLHSVGMVLANDRALVPPTRLHGLLRQFNRVAVAGSDQPLLWRLEVVDDFAIHRLPAVLAWFDGEVALRIGEGEPTRWDRWPDPRLLDRYLRSSQHYRVLTGPFDAITPTKEGTE